MYSRRACLVAWGAAAPLGGPGGAPRAPIPGGGTNPGGGAVASGGAAGGGAPMPPPGIDTPVSPSGGTSNSVGRRRWRRGISVGERDRDRRGMGGRRSRLRLRSRRDRSSSSLRSLWRRMHGKGGGKGKVSDERRECLGSCRARLVTTRYTRDPVVDRRVDETTEPPIVQDASISPARKTVMVSRHVPFPVAAVVPVPVVAAFISRARHGGNGVRVEEGRTRAAPRVIWSSLIRRQKGFGEEAREDVCHQFLECVGTSEKTTA